MCGRAYSTYTEEELQLRGFAKKRVKIPSFEPNYNFSPSQQTLVARAEARSVPPTFLSVPRVLALQEVYREVPRPSRTGEERV